MQDFIKISLLRNFKDERSSVCHFQFIHSLTVFGFGRTLLIVRKNMYSTGRLQYFSFYDFCLQMLFEIIFQNQELLFLLYFFNLRNLFTAPYERFSFLFNTCLYRCFYFQNYVNAIEKPLELHLAFYFLLSQQEQNDHVRFGTLFVTFPKSNFFVH